MYLPVNMQLLLLGVSVGFQTGWSEMCSSRSCQRPHCTRWGFFQPDFTLAREENGWTESAFTLGYKGTQFQLKTSRGMYCTAAARIILVCWKSTLAFFMTAVSSFVSFLLIFHRNSSSITLVSSSYRAAPAPAVGSCFQSSVWGTVLCLPLASSLAKLWFFFFVNSLIAQVDSTTVSIYCKT